MAAAPAILCRASPACEGPVPHIPGKARPPTPRAAVPRAHPPPRGATAPERHGEAPALHLARSSHSPQPAVDKCCWKPRSLLTTAASGEEPLSALAIRQGLHQVSPCCLSLPRVSTLPESALAAAAGSQVPSAESVSLDWGAREARRLLVILRTCGHSASLVVPSALFRAASSTVASPNATSS